MRKKQNIVSVLIISLFISYASAENKSSSIDPFKGNNELYEYSLRGFLVDCLLNLYFGEKEQAIANYQHYKESFERFRGNKEHKVPQFKIIKKDEYYFFQRDDINDGLEDPIYELEAYLDPVKNKALDLGIEKLINRIHETVNFRRSQWKWFRRGE